MAEKVERFGVKRSPNYLYFLRGSDIWRTPMKRARSGVKAEIVAQGDFIREEGYLYFLDSNGDVSRAARYGMSKPRKKIKKPQSRTKCNGLCKACCE